ncbi:MAG: substrate-binding periplasmic protein [Myxococcota bacterium]
MGLSLQHPPMAFTENNRLEGIEPDLARLAARSLDRRIQFVVLKPEELIPALKRRDLDVIVDGLALTESTDEGLLMTHPYFQSGQRLAVLDRDYEYQDRSAPLLLLNSRVGYIRKSAGEKYVKEHLTPHQTKTYSFHSTDEAARSLRSGRIDFLIDEGPKIWWLTQKSGESEIIVLPKTLTRVDLSWAVAPGNSGLQSELNTLIDQWRTTNELGRIIEKWVPSSSFRETFRSGRHRATVSGLNRR